MKPEPLILFEGPCAYVTRNRDDGPYVIMVHSSNMVRHVEVGSHRDLERARKVCAGLNAYPDNARRFAGV